MTPSVRFWKEEYGVAQPLEAESWIRRPVNRHMVAPLMNAFPKTATRVLSRSNGELARLLFREREGGSFRVLRAMYRFDDPHYRGDLIDRLLMQSPAVKAARNRRKIAQRMLEVFLRAMPPGRPILVLAIGEGDGSLEVEVIARLKEQKVYYLGIDRDERAVAENREVLRSHGLEDRGCTLVGSIAKQSDVETALEIAERRFNLRFDGVSICVCQGIVEYLDLHSDTNEALAGMLNAIQSCMRPGGRLIVNQTDHHDRVKYLEDGLSWHMRLRNSEELAAEVEKSRMANIGLQARADGADHDVPGRQAGHRLPVSLSQ